MKTFDITKKQILQLNSYDNYNIGVALKQWFPQAFESELEVGKWYKVKEEEDSFWFIEQIKEDGDGIGFGFCYGKYKFSDTIKINKFTFILATDKEVETALIAEAKRRGFKEGVKYFNASLPSFKETARNNKFKYINSDEVIFYLDGNTIFYNGKWAEIISEPIEVTLEEIAKKFNVNVEQLKIKK